MLSMLPRSSAVWACRVGEASGALSPLAQHCQAPTDCKTQALPLQPSGEAAHTSWRDRHLPAAPLCPLHSPARPKPT